MRRLVLLAVIATAAAAPQLARADGDPASDYLLGSKVFLPYDAKFPAKQAARLTALVAGANKEGFAIRVAVIWSDYDMGSVTSLWRRPRTYAKFLGLELSFVYKQRLLVVMPDGLGFNWPKHDPAPAYRLLATIPTGPRAAQLLAAASSAVTRLAAADGVEVTTPAHVTAPRQHTTDDRVIIIAAVAGALALAAAARYLIRRKGRG
jgi:hypothetical protein